MEFRIYDLLTNLIPGFIVYLAGLKFFGKPYDLLDEVPATAAAFVIGFFVNSLSAWLEKIFYITWGGNPKEKILDGEGTFRIKLLEKEKIKEMLNNDCSEKVEVKEILFNVAERFRNTYKDEDNKRVFEFFESYAFSRSLLTSILISSVLICSSFYYTDKFSFLLIISVLLIIIGWYRCKERSYYYAREVLDFYNVRRYEEKAEK